MLRFLLRRKSLQFFAHQYTVVYKQQYICEQRISRTLLSRYCLSFIGDVVITTNTVNNYHAKWLFIQLICTC